MITAAISDRPIGRGNWMQTYTGKRFYFADPRPEDIDIGDIAGALARQCRYGGHCLKFYSVAEHSVLAARAAPRRFRLATLMHDASEAYLMDVPRPLKPYLHGYAGMEERLMAAIAAKYKFPWPLPPEVKEIDNAILTDEREQNMAPMDVSPELWGNCGGRLGVKLNCWLPKRAEREFLHAFVRYTCGD